jgi:parallel beta-helix repeat protein
LTPERRDAGVDASEVASTACTVVLTASTHADPAMAAAEDQTHVEGAFADAMDHVTICFSPGHYHFTSTIGLASLTGVMIRGTGAARGDVILDFAPQASGERGISLTDMTDVTVERVTVIDATQTDLYVQRGQGVTLRDIAAGWQARTPSGSFAIRATLSTNVRIGNVEAYGSVDTGIQVDASWNSVVESSIAHDNLVGIEIENTVGCEVSGNVVHDDTTGIVVIDVPDETPHAGTISVHDNMVVHNDTPSMMVGSDVILRGAGIMVIAAHEVEIFHNTITDNGTAGVVLWSYSTAVALGAVRATDPSYDGFLRHVYVHDNAPSGNGSMPDTAFGVVAHLDGREVDVVWDGVTAPDDAPPQLCLATSGTFRNIDAPGGFTSPSDTIPTAAAACATPVLAPVAF